MDSAEDEVILRALAGEPEPVPPPPFIRRSTWHERLTANCWPRYFPHLFHPWWITDERGNDLCSGRRRKVSRWVNDYYREELHEWFETPSNAYLKHGPWYAAVPWLVHTDCDKRHRCPVCGHSGGFQQEMQKTGDYIRYWHIYTCVGCGQRAADRFYLREHPCDCCSMFSHLRYWPQHVWRSLDYRWALHVRPLTRRWRGMR